MDIEEKRNRIDEALRIRGMKPVELSEKTKLSQASISSYCKQRWQPKQKALVLMARALDVSEMWLAGYDVPMERPMEQAKMDQLAELVLVLKEDERLTNLIVSIRNLSEDQFNTVESMVQQLSLINSKR